MAHQELHSHWITLSGTEGSAGLSKALFPYWSFTKTVIAICALKLVENGILDLDSKLKSRAYTLRQLLAHTSGLPDYGQFPEYGSAVRTGTPPWTKEKMLDVALSRGMLFEPEMGWSYSNVGYMFICELLERTTSKALGEIVCQYVTEPLGLTSVELAQSPDQFAELHWPAAKGYDPRWVYHGCLCGTAADAARLLHALFTGQLLKAETLAIMTRAKILGGPISGRPWAECGYALGLMAGSVEDLGRSLGHSGAGPFCVNAVYHFPDASDPITIACFTQGTDEGLAEYELTKILKHQFPSLPARSC